MIWQLSSSPPPTGLNLEQLRLVIALSEHVVLAIQQTFLTTGTRKKKLATQVLTELLVDCGLPAHPALVDVAIESPVKVMKIFENT